MDDPATATIQTCAVEIVVAARAEGAQSVDIQAGRVSRRSRDGYRRTRLRVVIRYPNETREAVVLCKVDRDGKVTLAEEL